MALICFISSSFTGFFYHQQRQVLTDALFRKGELLAGILALNSRVGVYSENKALLTDPVEGIFQQKEVLDVAVFNAGGELLIKKSRFNTGSDEAPKPRFFGNAVADFKKLTKTLQPKTVDFGTGV